MILKILKLVLGIFLIPLAVSVAHAFYIQLGYIDINFTQAQIYFLWGVTAYCLFQLLIIKPVYIYVLGHEVIHVLATWLCLGKVTSFRVTSKGGSVSTTKSNIFIKLSPYFVPIYAIILTGLYFAIVRIYIWGFMVKPIYLFLFGFTLVFHIVMTVDTIKTKQPDFAKTGHLISLILIITVNIIMIAGILGLFFDSFSFLSFLKNVYAECLNLYRIIYMQMASLKIF